jgi:hypothetical protein
MTYDIKVDRIHSLNGELRDGRWQVIFKTREGLDYCRETVDGEKTLDAVKVWAEAQARVHGLGGAVIERW